MSASSFPLITRNKRGDKQPTTVPQMNTNIAGWRKREREDLHCSKISFKCITTASQSSAIRATRSDSFIASAAMKNLCSASAICFAIVLAAPSTASAEKHNLGFCLGLDLTAFCFGEGVLLANEAFLAKEPFLIASEAFLAKETFLIANEAFFILYFL